ncbi:MAG: flavin-nucleotide-binding protein [Saprospirales bacterium]|nr:flavin-nucleotide-binding protein [Saprospirales bacterium]
MEYPTNDRNKVKRLPKRGHYDQETIFGILDDAFLCHVGFEIAGQPYVIPTAYGRDGEVLYLHGSSKSRMIQHLATGAPLCLTVTHLDGLVLARSAFHHSMNYRSAVIFGTATLVEGEEKMHALEVISEQILKGRWAEVRQPNPTEMKATSVLRITIEQASAKIRTGPPGDEAEDYALPIWAGVVPAELTFQDPLPDPAMDQAHELPASVKALARK